jgi:adenylate cyclase
MQNPQLTLIYRANIFVVNRARPSLQMGRDDGNDIVVASLFASRLHARVEMRDGRFVLTDLSSNGTFLHQDDAQCSEVRLRQEEAVLTGRGRLGLGKSAELHGDHSVRYSVQAESA